MNRTILAQSWQDYMQSGVIGDTIRPEIAASWERCRKAGVDPNDGCGLVRSEQETAALLCENEELISVTEPILRNLYAAIQGLQVGMMLSDAAGHILLVVGQQEGEELIDGINMRAGVRWLEEDVGTNAVALCLRHDRPIQIAFEEHYCRRHQVGYCASAPIHSAAELCIGTLTLVSTQFNEQTRGVCLAGADLIQRQIALLNSKNMTERIIDSMTDGILLLDEGSRVTRMNAAAQRVIGADFGAYIGKDIRSMVDRQTTKLVRPDQDMYFNLLLGERSVTCIGRITPIFFNKQRSGAMIVFNEECRMTKLANQIAGNQATYHFRDIVTQNSRMMATIDQCRTIAPTDCNVLITGESGTGKELFAQSIHNESRRRKGPFIAINCAALPRELVESELFGYDGGAFTGAKKEGQPGKFELASGGTLFLDEVGELPLEIQSKLLRVLDNHKVTRIGGKTEKEVDVRVITATNRTLEDEVRKNNFRLDLLYRINVFTVSIIPLRERKDDLTLLTDYFLTKLNKNRDRIVEGATDAFYDALQKSDWRGNVRQLQNVIARAYYLCTAERMDVDCLPPELFDKKEGASPGRADTSAETTRGPHEALWNAEQDMFIKAIRDCGGNMSEAARMLRMSRATFYRKVKLLGITYSRTVSGN